MIFIHLFSLNIYLLTVDWNVYDIKTFKHPSIPYDILIDELSIPQLQNMDDTAKNTNTNISEKVGNTETLPVSNDVIAIFNC